MSFDRASNAAAGTTRAELARQAVEAVDIARRGSYVAPSGRLVEIGARVARAVSRTVEHRPDDALDVPSRGDVTTRVTVVNGTSLASARALAAGGHVPLVLNFASAHVPGGGFLNGARAQEESLARSSALYATIAGREMYAHHDRQRDPLYTSWMIWSPEVPVFRGDDGALLEDDVAVSFLTAAAPNASVIRERSPARVAEVDRVMRERVARSLAVAAHHGERHLVLGAWGCGVFGNDPAIVADAYRHELAGAYAGVFDEVVFAVMDGTPDRRFIRAFLETFPGTSQGTLQGASDGASRRAFQRPPSGGPGP